MPRSALRAARASRTQPPRGRDAAGGRGPAAGPAVPRAGGARRSRAGAGSATEVRPPSVAAGRASRAALLVRVGPEGRRQLERPGEVARADALREPAEDELRVAHGTRLAGSA